MANITNTDMFQLWVSHFGAQAAAELTALLEETKLKGHWAGKDLRQ